MTMRVSTGPVADRPCTHANPPERHLTMRTAQSPARIPDHVCVGCLDYSLAAEYGRP